MNDHCSLFLIYILKSVQALFRNIIKNDCDLLLFFCSCVIALRINKSPHAGGELIFCF